MARLDIRIKEEMKNKLIKIANHNNSSLTKEVEDMINEKYKKIKGAIEMKKLEELKKMYDKIGYRVTTVDGKSNTEGITREDYYIVVSKKVTPNQFDIRDYEGYNLEQLENMFDYYKGVNMRSESDISKLQLIMTQAKVFPDQIGYWDDLKYDQGKESKFKAKQIAERQENKEIAEMILKFVE